MTLIQSALANLPVYFMSPLKCPMFVVNRIEKLERDFLWQDGDARKKIHLANWNSICQSKKYGGLGIKPLKLMNQAFLGKWLWRLRDGSDSLWRDIVLAKYKVGRNGWDTKRASYRHSSLWKGIMSVKDSFAMNIRY